MTSRRSRLPIERRNGNTERIGKRRRRVSRDVGDAGLDSVDVEVPSPEAIGELLPAQFLRLANLSNPSSNDGEVLTHQTYLSNSDRQNNVISAPVIQVRDSLGEMLARYDLSWEEAEVWVRDLGFVRDDGKVDWEKFLPKANVGQDQYNLKRRWRLGEAVENRQKIQSTLERLEAARKQPTDFGARIAMINEWIEIGRALSQFPEVFNAEMERLRGKAAQAMKVTEGERARAALLSPTPEPKKPRK